MNALIELWATPAGGDPDRDQDRRDHAAADDPGRVLHLRRAQDHRLHAGAHRALNRLLRLFSLLGLGQPIADAVKLMFKEIVIPSGANKLLVPDRADAVDRSGAGGLGRVSRSMPGSCCADINAGLLYILAMTSLGRHGVIIAGWASNSESTPFLRLDPLGGTDRLLRDRDGLRAGRRPGRRRQPESWRHRRGAAGQCHCTGSGCRCCRCSWCHFHLRRGRDQPRAASTSPRANPRSSPVSTSSIPGMTFAVFFLAEYANMILISALTALMFLGGWLSPFPESLGRRRVPARRRASTGC